MIATLNGSAETLTIVLAGAKTTVDATYSLQQSLGNGAPTSIVGNTNGITATTMATGESPQKVFESLYITNNDTGAITVTVKKVTAAGSYPLISALVLQVGSILTFNKDGVSVVNSSGQASGGSISLSTTTLLDDVLSTLGTDSDQVRLNRSTTLNAATALTGAIVGTPVTAAIPANSLIVSNVTADGDQVFIAQTGGNSMEWMRYDSSATLIVFNEASGDVDLRVETDGNANALNIDGGTNSVAVGSAVVVGAAFSVSNLTARGTVTSVGVQVHLPIGTFNDSAAANTIAVMADSYLGIQTHTATNARTYTDCASVYIAGAPVASTNVTQTRSYALYVAAGTTRLAGDLQQQFSAASGDGAISIKSGYVYITKGSAAALTIADPTATTDDGKELTIIATSAFAHTLDNSAGSGFNAGGAATDVGTFGGAKGDNICITAYQGKWYVKSKVNVTLG